jgi:hypothetical protein
MDGAEAFYTSNPDTLIQVGGWEGGSNTINEQWFSLDDGVNWTAYDTAEWSPRHTFGFTRHKNGWIVAGSDLYDTEGQDEVWYSSNGLDWTAKTLAAEFGNRIMIAAVSKNDTLFVIGGQIGTSSPTVLRDVWYSTDDGVTWTELCSSCAPEIGNMSGTTTVWRNKIWVVAGEKYDDGGGHTRYNTVYSSPDGLIWTQHSNLPTEGLSYPKVFTFKGRLCFYGGFSDSNGNERFFYSTSDGENWNNGTASSMLVTHAAAVATKGEEFFISTSGNLFDDVQKAEVEALLVSYEGTTIVSRDRS